MRKNFYDLVVEKMFEKQYLAKRVLHRKFQKTNPPRTVKVDPKRMIEEYQTLSLPQVNALRAVYGEDTVNGYMEYMNKLMAGEK